MTGQFRVHPTPLTGREPPAPEYSPLCRAVACSCGALVVYRTDVPPPEWCQRCGSALGPR